MIVYVLMKEWDNGFEGGDILEEIYSTWSEAHRQAEELEAKNKDTDVSWRVIKWDVVEGEDFT